MRSRNCLQILTIMLLSACGGGGGGSDGGGQSAGGNSAPVDISLSNVNAVFEESFTRLEVGTSVADLLLRATLGAPLTPGAVTSFSCDSGDNFVEYQSLTTTIESGDVIIDSHSACTLSGVTIDGVIRIEIGASTDAPNNFYSGVVTFDGLTVTASPLSRGIRGSLAFSLDLDDASFSYSNSTEPGDALFEVGFGSISNEFSEASIFDVTRIRRFNELRTLDLDVVYDSELLNQTVILETTPQLSAPTVNDWPTFGGLSISAGSSFVEIDALEDILNLGVSFAIFSININGTIPSAPNPNPNPDPLAPSLIFNDVRWDEISNDFFIPFGT